MSRDFTVEVYEALLRALQGAGYVFQTLEQFVARPAKRVVISRHDVDRRPHNALAFARLQHRLGIPATFYFRTVPESYDPAIIRQIASLGHEIGYHYEDMALCGGDYDRAIAHFETALERFRQHYPVRTICMHGSPLSRWDNKLLWSRYRYQDHGILAEPYFDLDFSRILYLTDTGRTWQNRRISVRDRVSSTLRLDVRTTFELIAAVRQGKLPDQVMITTHPQRWSDAYLLWSTELVLQNLKNVVKAGLSGIRNSA